jgi:hypothetical protein
MTCLSSWFFCWWKGLCLVPISTDFTDEEHQRVLPHPNDWTGLVSSAPSLVALSDGMIEAMLIPRCKQPFAKH